MKREAKSFGGGREPFVMEEKEDDGNRSRSQVSVHLAAQAMETTIRRTNQCHTIKGRKNPLVVA